jgi:hypothetical protein
MTYIRHIATSSTYVTYTDLILAGLQSNSDYHVTTLILPLAVGNEHRLQNYCA